MNTLLRKAAVVTVGSALLLGGGFSATAQAEPKAIKCETKSTGGTGPFYDGKAASNRYDSTFKIGPAVPRGELKRGTPQGVAAWNNWDGKKDLLLATSYGKKGQKAHIVALDPAQRNKVVGTVAIAESHVGGIAVAKGWAFVSGRASGKWATVRKYKLSTLKKAIKEKGVPYVKQTGKARKVYGASYLSTDGSKLYAGKFTSKGRGKMYSYTINSNGSLTTIKKPWETPTKTQGVLVTGKHFIYSTSYGRTKRGNIYVVRRGTTDLDKAKLHCFRGPSMSEGIAAYGGRAYVVFESGSYKYSGDSRTRNVIEDLHWANLSALTKLA
ncbi:hypothetical protein [Sciscionella marina]|uniref:hypothetical protein n=1 Tax=Sciscionella marina TaxID=508770 RepID=UPI000369EE76|nr:hypothetical protein [Sciscionella marina]